MGVRDIQRPDGASACPVGVLNIEERYLAAAQDTYSRTIVG
jgi:hypothetical protein